MIPSLQSLTAQAAMVSAAITMPEGGLSLIKERFEDALVSDTSDSSTNEKTAATSSEGSTSEETASTENEASKAPVEKPENAGEIVEEDFNIQSSSTMIKFGSRN